MPYVSNRRNWEKWFEGEMSKRVKAASIYLTAEIKKDISQPGTLRYGKGKRGKTVYNFTHSRPGNPPYKQKGTLRRSIAWVLWGPLVGRVGSNLKNPRYPLFLEMGTKRMAARPYLRAALITHRRALKAILTKMIPAGGFAQSRSNQFRSGHFGRGAASAGWG